MINTKNLKILSFITILSFLLIGCNGKLPGGDARKNSPDPAERVKKNLEEGRGFKLMDLGKNRGGTFEFASSNELWRASLDVIDFMPLTSVIIVGVSLLQIGIQMKKIKMKVLKYQLDFSQTKLDRML